MMAEAPFRPDCRTTAMAIMPHRDIDRAIELALSLDIPYWPQLPRCGFYEDMYVQAVQNFPGIALDPTEQKISFSMSRFAAELPEYAEKMADPATFALDPGLSVAYYRFLSLDLSSYPAIRGQVSGPVNLGFRIVDEESRPIIYSDEVRPVLFDFIQRKANAQYRQLRERNGNAFVWLDEPGLIWVFSGFSGYNDVQAKQDYAEFLAGIEGLKALHLCSNVNLPYLLEMGAGFVSFDAYQIEVMPRAYADQVARFLSRGRIISWGLVPTEPALLARETPDSLTARLLDYWTVISDQAGIALRDIARQALIAPAKCCLRSADAAARHVSGTCAVYVEEESVEKAFDYLKAVSQRLKDRFSLPIR